MIITGGSYKGRKVKTVKSREIRPTSSIVRQGIFNIVRSILAQNQESLCTKELVMLDLFAGSGIVGLEALSRGIKKVVFVEKNPKIAKILKENLSNFECDYQLIISDAILALDKLKDFSFNIIFVDPPYESGLVKPVLEKIKNNNLLEHGGIIIVEHRSNYDLGEIAKNLDLNVIKIKKYSDTSITIFNIES